MDWSEEKGGGKKRKKEFWENKSTSDYVSHPLKSPRLFSWHQVSLRLSLKNLCLHIDTTHSKRQLGNP